MSFHEAVRRAIVTRLKGAVGVPIYSAPPANAVPPYVVVGAITAERNLVKGSCAAFYTAAVESWVQSTSPAQLDALSDAVDRQLDGAPMSDPNASLSPPARVSETDTLDLDAPAGPTLGRIQAYRLLAQPLG